MERMGAGPGPVLDPSAPAPRGRSPGPSPGWEPTNSPFFQPRNPPLDFHLKRKFRKRSMAWVMVGVITQQLFPQPAAFFCRHRLDRLPRASSTGALGTALRGDHIRDPVHPRRPHHHPTAAARDEPAQGATAPTPVTPPRHPLRRGEGVARTMESSHGKTLGWFSRATKMFGALC